LGFLPFLSSGLRLDAWVATILSLLFLNDLFLGLMPASIDILYEDGPVLVVNKPAGLATQAPPQFDSLEARVRQFLAERVGAVFAYLGVPHRLDRPVSGAILFATKRRAAFKLSRQFERRSIGKQYVAAVQGSVEPAAGTWSDHLRKVYGRPRAEIVAESDVGAQLAVLHYQTINRSNDFTLLGITLETGRTHQIRVQAASRNHAVLGDAFYGSTVPFGPATDDERQRAIALHARSITFNHPTTGERVAIEAPFPEFWRNVV
jgi:RluA family pseudouridine synthase